jgi:hypothetical protein
MGTVVTGGYPGRQAILPNTLIEWAKLIVTLSLLALFIVTVSNANVLKAVSDFVLFISRRL